MRLKKKEILKCYPANMLPFFLMSPTPLQKGDIRGENAENKRNLKKEGEG
jgi:hypothetical protein